MLGSTAVPPTEIAIGALPIDVGSQYTLLWEPYYRHLYEQPLSSSNKPPAARQSTTCFAVGVKETIEISTTDGNPWQWRRIVFAAKGVIIPGAYRDYTTRTVELADESLLYQRANTPLPDAMASDLYRFLFRGLGTNTDSLLPRDWINRMTAKIDTTRVSVLYDKLVNVRSGNASGVNFNANRYHPIGKNIVYADEENGSKLIGSPVSTQGKPGIGDIYILDLIDGSGVQAVTTGNFYFNPTTTVYWHEK